MSTSVRRRLEAQGYCGLDDATLREIGGNRPVLEEIRTVVEHPAEFAGGVVGLRCSASHSSLTAPSSGTWTASG